MTAPSNPCASLKRTPRQAYDRTAFDPCTRILPRNAACHRFRSRDRCIDNREPRARCSTRGDHRNVLGGWAQHHTPCSRRRYCCVRTRHPAAPRAEPGILRRAYVDRSWCFQPARRFTPLSCKINVHRTCASRTSTPSWRLHSFASAWARRGHSRAFRGIRTACAFGSTIRWLKSLSCIAPDHHRRRARPGRFSCNRVARVADYSGTAVGSDVSVDLRCRHDCWHDVDHDGDCRPVQLQRALRISASPSWCSCRCGELQLWTFSRLSDRIRERIAPLDDMNTTLSAPAEVDRPRPSAPQRLKMLLRC